MIDLTQAIEHHARQAANDGRSIDSCPHPESSAAETIWKTAYRARAAANDRITELMAGILP